jgi:hypothetical protein
MLKQKMAAGFAFAIFGLLVVYGLIAGAAASLTGRLVIDSADNDRFWYVSPRDNRRYELGFNARQAQGTIQRLAMGISDANLNLIPRGKDSPIQDQTMSRRLSGYFLKAIESGGEIWYVNPLDLRRYYFLPTDISYRFLRSLAVADATGELKRYSIGFEIPAPKVGCMYGNPACAENSRCMDNICVAVPPQPSQSTTTVVPPTEPQTTIQGQPQPEQPPQPSPPQEQPPSPPQIGCRYQNPACGSDQDCKDNACIKKQGCAYRNPVCAADQNCLENVCVQKTGCQYGNPACPADQDCRDGLCVLKKGCQYRNPECAGNQECKDNICINKKGCAYENPSCASYQDCKDNACVKKPGCAYSNPACTADYVCAENQCVKKPGCKYHNPDCTSEQDCVENSCVQKKGCQYSHPACGSDYECKDNACLKKKGCLYDNPSCARNQDCTDNACVLKKGCAYANPICAENQDCNNNECTLKKGCNYNNPGCTTDEECRENRCVRKAGCAYDNPGCASDYVCTENQCVKRQGCKYRNPVCGQNYDCQDNVCVLKPGCVYGNPYCSSDRECIDNVCILKKGCYYNNPGCKANQDCLDNVCVLKKGCLYDNPACATGQLCIDNSCIKPLCKTDAECDADHPGQYECKNYLSCVRRTFNCDNKCAASQYCVKGSCVDTNSVTYVSGQQSYFCRANEVLMDGRCVQATQIIIAAQNPDVDSALFEQRTKEAVAAIRATTPLGACDTRRIKVILEHKFCCTEDTKLCLQRIAPYDAAIVFNNGNFGSCKVVSGPGDKIIIANQNAISAMPHEYGHVMGLWDQYCYFQDYKNPNPVDYTKGGCRPATDQTLKEYCSHSPTGRTVTPYQCSGMRNAAGWAGAMGVSGADIGAPSYGFTDQEYNYMKSNLVCRPATN